MDVLNFIMTRDFKYLLQMQSIEFESILIPFKDTMTCLYDSKYILIRNIDDDGTVYRKCTGRNGA